MMGPTPPAPVTPNLESRGEASRRAWLLATFAVVVALAAVAGGVIADAVAEAPVLEPVAEPVAQGPAGAGVWYCPAVAGEDERAFVTLTAVGEEAATATLVRYNAAAPEPADPVEVTPGESVDIPLEPGTADTPVAVQWEGGPLLATWRLHETDLAGAACVDGPSEQWHVAGLSTAEGAQSRLHLFNPFTVDAVVRVVFGTAEGRVALVLTDNVVVEAGTNRVVDLGEFLPEEADLAVTVEVLSGRVVAAGDLELAPEGQQTGPTGRTLVPAASTAGDDWAFGWGEADADTASHLSVYNPSDRDAAVELQVTEPNPEGPALAEQSVPAGGLIRIDLSELSTAAALSVRVRTATDVGIVVARVSAFSGEAEAVAASLGAPPSPRSGIAGVGAGPRDGQLALFNPGGEPVSVDVTVGEGQPDAWSSIELAANTRVVLDLDDVGDRSTFPVLVEATGPVVAEALSTARTGDNLRAMTLPAVAERVWRGPPQRPAVRRDRALTTSPIPVDEPFADDEVDLDAPSPLDAEAPPAEEAPEVDGEAPDGDEPPGDTAPPGAA